ncbi:hypothetical protein [Pontibacter populi]|uniref:Lipoprotein n=1 Tax=Pontibacter populi TaxID=890055 RepID=A0ABV1RU77_9BACT
MCRFLKYSYSLLLCLFAFACSQVKQEEKPVEIPFTQDDLTQIYSLAFDSLLGPAIEIQSLPYLKINDSVIVETVFNVDWSYEFSKKKNLLNEDRGFQRKKSLQKYAGFDTDKFREIIADSSLIYKEYKGAHKVGSSYKYKSIVVESGRESYGINEPAGIIYFEKVSFNRNSDHAIVRVHYYNGPEMGSGNAYFLKKENDKWRVVGVHRLFIS